ncbi:hypothetical protein NDU88_004588 [Pleurodeles waltl]|uniref:Uncharacterized protein n=1 Tax=Pleurodeles waltl TaxID=8319 RepID=A0AAV7TT49_PLEWA|nr:hypothetical protein NDU88_004588 [Pleurodeles waltl]
MDEGDGSGSTAPLIKGARAGSSPTFPQAEEREASGGEWARGRRRPSRGWSDRDERPAACVVPVDVLLSPGLEQTLHSPPGSVRWGGMGGGCCSLNSLPSQPTNLRGWGRRTPCSAPGDGSGHYRSYALTGDPPGERRSREDTRFAACRSDRGPVLFPDSASRGSRIPAVSWHSLEPPPPESASLRLRE